MSQSEPGEVWLVEESGTMTDPGRFDRLSGTRLGHSELVEDWPDEYSETGWSQSEHIEDGFVEN